MRFFMNIFDFSVIKIFDNDSSSISEFINSITHQKHDFKDNIELILIDLGSIDGSNQLVLDYKSEFPENIKVLEAEDKYGAYNLALENARGKFIHFSENQDILNENTLSIVYKSISKYSDEADIFALSNNESGIFDLNDYPEHSLIDLDCTFINRNASEGISFNEKLSDCADKLFISQIIQKKEKVVLVKGKHFTSPEEESEEETLSKENVQNKFDYFFNFLLKCCDKPYFQYIIANELPSIIHIEDLDELFDNDKEIDEFWGSLYKILDCIDMGVLKENKTLNSNDKSFLIYLINKEFHIEVKKESDEVFLMSDDYLINDLSKHRLRFDIVEAVDGFLNLSGSLTSNCYPRDITFKAIRKFENGKSEEFRGKYVEYPTTNRKIKRFLGISWEFTYNFDMKIPLKADEKSSLTFKTVFSDGKNSVEMENNIIFREFAGLSVQGNYLIKDNRIIFFRLKTFYIMPYSYIKVLKLELKSIVRILRLGGPFITQAIFYRLLYVILYPLWKNKKIWLFVDRQESADDNAEHLFKYSIEQDDGITKYFAINKDCDDYRRLNKDCDNVIAFGSFKHKLNYLFSEKIVISQVTRARLNPFTHENNRLYEGLNTYKFCFLQHGVTKDDISWWIKKFHKNLYMFLTVSEMERQSIINGHYNYDEDRVPVLGFPRFDNLTSKSEKQILIIPTWRRDLENYKDFISSGYYENLKNLLSDERLIEKCDELGYKIVFKPHPELLKFRDLFKLDNIELSDEPFQKLFEKASLMITDFSSVAFDFAYLKKPVIYYHENDDYHYEKGYYDYPTMGFGEIVYNSDELVSKVIKYMENDCIMKEEYVSRVDSFFKYHDKDNCKRVYDWLYNH